jgi:LmbE family N-acetylglucosaminyl deacetylase
MLKVNAFDKLMIVAHPDDEIIFGGAELLSEFGWLVICVTNRSEPVRASEFDVVMRKVGCVYEMWDYIDRSNLQFPQDNLTKNLSRVIHAKKYKKIVTHASNGEYGHPHHVQIHHTVASITNDFYVFGRGNCLPNDVWIKKLRLMTIYQSQRKMCKSLLYIAKHERSKKYGPVQNIENPN